MRNILRAERNENSIADYDRRQCPLTNRYMFRGRVIRNLWKWRRWPVLGIGVGLTSAVLGVCVVGLSATHSTRVGLETNLKLLLDDSPNFQLRSTHYYKRAKGGPILCGEVAQSKAMTDGNYRRFVASKGIVVVESTDKSDNFEEAWRLHCPAP